MRTDKKIKVLVTGANGFIGRNLCSFLKEEGHSVRAAVRSDARDVLGIDEYVRVGGINASTEWANALQNIDTVIHLAGFVDVSGTQRLAEEAAQAGIKRFIFASSVKVNGENGVFTEESRPDPKGHYAVSKLESEEKVISACRNSNMEDVILRLPLVYGPGVKANFLQLMRLVDKEIPFPFGSVHNKRSFLYVRNLCDVIQLCLLHPAAARQLFLVSDGSDLSTPQLISMIAERLDKKAGLFVCHVFLLRIAGLLTGKSAVISRLIDSLSVQTTKLTTLTGWKPRFSVKEGIAETVSFYKGAKHEKGI